MVHRPHGGGEGHGPSARGLLCVCLLSPSFPRPRHRFRGTGRFEASALNGIPFNGTGNDSTPRLSDVSGRLRDDLLWVNASARNRARDVRLTFASDPPLMSFAIHRHDRKRRSVFPGLLGLVERALVDLPDRGE